MARYWHVKDLAQKFDRHPRTIYRWLDEGFIRGKKVRSNWVISEEEVEKVIWDPFEDEDKPGSKN